MATEQTSATPDSDDTEDKERRPYIVVLMSAEMKLKVKEYADANDTNPTALARTLLAERIGYDLSGEPQPTKRAKYSSDDERAAAHKVASKKSGLLRKALFQMHNATLKKRTELLAAASTLVMQLSDPNGKPDMATLEAWDTSLNESIKAGK